MAEKFTVPTEMIDLPSKGLVYPKENPLSAGVVEMKYMTAREEDILTNVNLLRQGLAIEKMLKSLIKTEVKYEDLTLGDRNALLIAARILAYGKDYNLKYANPNTLICLCLKTTTKSLTSCPSQRTQSLSRFLRSKTTKRSTTRQKASKKRWVKTLELA